MVRPQRYNSTFNSFTLQITNNTRSTRITLSINNRRHRTNVTRNFNRALRNSNFTNTNNTYSRAVAVNRTRNLNGQLPYGINTSGRFQKIERFIARNWSLVISNQWVVTEAELGETSMVPWKRARCRLSFARPSLPILVGTQPKRWSLDKRPGP